MAHEILSAKLCEMDTKITKIHSRIRKGEHLSKERLLEETDTLRIEVNEEEQLILKSLLHSKADISSGLRMDFEVLNDKYKSVFDKLRKEFEESTDLESQAEMKALLAEYGIDFAMLSVDYAMLLAFEAIEAEKNLTEEEDIL